MAQNRHILLASASPRRQELLKMLIPDFEMAAMHEIDESYPDDLPLEEIPAYLSRLKADAYRQQITGNDILLTADTIVINNGKVLGKPHSEAEAVEMLRALSGHTHKVVTGVTLTSADKTDTFTEETLVKFATLSDDEITDYVRDYRPLDKAGAYGIQEWIGCIGIEGIDGCFYNVMGLPLHRLYRHLCTF